MRLTGQWREFENHLYNTLNYKNIQKAKKKALSKALAYLGRQIQENIKTGGRLAGKPFVPLSEPYEKYKLSKGKNKILIFSADMRNNIKVTVFDSNNGFVGIARGKIHKSGEVEIFDIALAHEKGMITEEKESLPPRPFVLPTFLKFKDEMFEIYALTIKENLNL